ncbi:MAG: hypothetical protein Q4G26_03585, partial [Paracoccus sp. (in: a-proteobacteria)]|nr:hypothetical protein [Paracoccus sp. (in: a-proteobacteria)]
MRIRFTQARPPPATTLRGILKTPDHPVRQRSKGPPMALLMGIDSGLTVTKAVIFTETGKVVAMA